MRQATSDKRQATISLKQADFDTRNDYSNKKITAAVFFFYATRKAVA